MSHSDGECRHRADTKLLSDVFIVILSRLAAAQNQFRLAEDANKNVAALFVVFPCDRRFFRLRVSIFDARKLAQNNENRE